jgi:transcriptional regulator with XRE-family HTH domain
LRYSWLTATAKYGKIGAEVIEMTLGQRISELRKERGYAQEYVAEQMGISRQAVSKWETDQCAPDTYNLIALSELFGVTVEYLATGKQQNEVPPQPQTTQTVVQVTRPSLQVWHLIDIVLLTVGLLSAVLGLVLDMSPLLLFAGALVIGAIVDLSCAKHAGLICLWAQWAYIAVVEAVVVGSPLAVFSSFWAPFSFLLSLFRHSNPSGVMRLDVVGLLHSALLIVNIVWTVRVLWKRKR